MLRDIRNLAAQYAREHWLRDLVAAAAFVAVVAMLYFSRIEIGNTVYAVRLSGAIEGTRNLCVYLWVGAAVIYALCTLFGGYGDARRSYAALLLPASAGAKFAWETARTLLIFPAATLGLWYAFDACYMCFVIDRIPAAEETISSLASIWDSVTATREPLNYIPFMSYALVWMHCVATLARSGINRVAGAAMMLAAWFAAEMWGIERWPFVATDYVDDLWTGSWRSRVSWCSCTTGYALSYIWYAALPIAIYAAAYFKFKERRMK